MSLESQVKQTIIEQNAVHTGDTGSPEVQIALIHARIQQITQHLKANKKDYHSQRGLLTLVGKRRRIEGYLRRIDINRYRALIQKLGIREVRPR